MPILIMVVSALAGLAFWIWRLRAAGRVERDAIGAAQSAKGYVTRRRIAGKTAFSPIAAIDDPAVAGATWLRFQADDEAWAARRADGRAFLAREVGAEAADEAMIYAEWAARQDVDRHRAVRTLRAQLETWLDPQELAGLDALLGPEAGEADGEDAR